ncbi:response regulator [Desulfobacula phenolica]|uniref:Response regulator receiver domain-containing protein n=1 Tax=Desulfobacula phenolica TaxID=90732 RepID=A0A1H2KF87_9BACT|nr:response regulator [Desulfobacula phenolica]SDU67088.1 Response regulator receiver domain-containing protein [Desulfobacula phenolica]
MNTESQLNSILIIDDEPSVLKFLRLFLSRNGFRVDVAENGEEGINKIETHAYSLIVTDIKMQSLSGDQLLYYLRKVLNDVTPVVAMSGTPRFLGYDEFDAVLHKPCSIKEILKILCRCLSESCRQGVKR